MKGRKGARPTIMPHAWNVGDTVQWWAPAPRWKRWAAKLLGIESPVVKHEARITAIQETIIEYEEIT
jgi:hypothetical protein